MTQGYANRLSTERFVDDPPVHIYRCDRTGPATNDLWMPERIWHRLRMMGAAYEMRLLPLLDGSTDPIFLNEAQCTGLEAEVRFIAELVADPLVEDLVRKVLPLLDRASHGTSKDLVGIEFS